MAWPNWPPQNISQSILGSQVYTPTNNSGIVGLANDMTVQSPTTLTQLGWNQVGQLAGSTILSGLYVPPINSGIGGLANDGTIGIVQSPTTLTQLGWNQVGQLAGSTILSGLYVPTINSGIGGLANDGTIGIVQNPTTLTQLWNQVDLPIGYAPGSTPLFRSQGGGEPPLLSVIDNASFGSVLQLLIMEASNAFATYSAAGSAPVLDLPGSVECTGPNTQSLLVRCTVLRSPNLVLAEAGMGDTVTKVQRALPGSDWTKVESETLADFDANWRRRTVEFANPLAVIVDIQLWQSKDDGHYDVDVVVSTKR